MRRMVMKLMLFDVSGVVLLGVDLVRLPVAAVKEGAGGDERMLWWVSLRGDATVVNRRNDDMGWEATGYKTPWARKNQATRLCA